MTTNEKALFNQIKENPEFLGEASEVIADMVCLLFLEFETTTDDDKRFEIQNVLSSACKTRMDIRKLLL